MEIVLNETYNYYAIDNITERNFTEVLLNICNFTINCSTSENATTSTLHKRKLPKSYYPILISALLASILCLIATIIIYSKLQEFKNIPGKNLISLSVCLIITYSLLMFDFLFNRSIPKTMCKALAIVTHMSFLSVFMWTNVMSFDIWQTVISSHRTSSPQSRRFKYWKYALYAWIGTIILALPAIIVDLAKLLTGDVTPSFATRRCWLNGTPAFLIYFNAPVGIILITNFTFFGLTARALIQIRKMTAKLNVHHHRKRFHLYLKLFIIMGMVWLSEFIPWITGYYALYMVAGLITALYGVFLFVIFICKRNVLQSIKKEQLCAQIFCMKTLHKSGTMPTISETQRNQSSKTIFYSSRTSSTSNGNKQSSVSFTTHM